MSAPIAVDTAEWRKSTRQAWANWWEWQRYAENLDRATYCQRMSAIDVGCSLDLIDSVTALVCRIDATLGAAPAENRAADATDQGIASASHSIPDDGGDHLHGQAPCS